jgi:predicted amino acid racemase
VIIALGRQDVLVSGLTVPDSLNIIGSSSDHLILEDRRKTLNIGSEVSFGLNYGALLAAMTSPFIQKEFIISNAVV